LPFVGIEEVSATYQRVKKRYADIIEADLFLQKWVRYYENRWMKPERLNEWNLLRLPLSDPRTNNHLEGFHHGINTLTKNRTNNIWLIVKSLQENCEISNLEFRQLEKGKKVGRDKSSTQKADQSLLESRVSAYRRQAVST
jgi:hypothetical protein